MTLTQKETGLLTDLKSQEALCIEKYKKYENEANDSQLKKIFSDIRMTEESHMKTITDIMSGTEVKMPSSPPSATEAKVTCTQNNLSQEQKQADAYLCRDALAMEKHVSSVYDISIFEFSNPVLRDTLSHIQKEEQNHGQMLYSYMACCGLYG